MEEIKEFYLKLLKDDEFKTKLAQFVQKNGEDPKNIIEKLVLPQAKKMGYNFTKEDLLSYEKENEENGLSDEDLLNVSGGTGGFIQKVTGLALLLTAAIPMATQATSAISAPEANLEVSISQTYSDEFLTKEQEQERATHIQQMLDEENQEQERAAHIQEMLDEENQEQERAAHIQETLDKENAEDEKDLHLDLFFDKESEYEVKNKEEKREEDSSEVAVAETTAKEDEEKQVEGEKVDEETEDTELQAFFEDLEDDETPPAPVARTKEQKEAHRKTYLDKLANEAEDWNLDEFFTEDDEKQVEGEKADEETEDIGLQALFEDLNEEENETPPPLPARDAPAAPTAPAPPSTGAHSAMPTSLLEEIQQGKKLKNVKGDIEKEQEQNKDQKTTLMDQIKQGKKLKHVEIQDKKEENKDPESMDLQDQLEEGLKNRIQPNKQSLDLNNEKEQGKKEIDDMLDNGDITEDQAVEAKARIDSAETPEEIDSILDDLFE